MNAVPGDDREEMLILVDSDDREIGQLPKRAGHLDGGVLHRAFSVFLFDSTGRLLIQQRSAEKMLWPGYWSNSVCSHPRPGESAADAAVRRVREELSVDCRLEFLYKFEYRARFGTVGSENELCHVFAGFPRVAGGFADLRADAAEVADWRWVEPAELTRMIAAEPDRFSPWMKLEWARIETDHLERILRIAREVR